MQELAPLLSSKGFRRRCSDRVARGGEGILRCGGWAKERDHRCVRERLRRRALSAETTRCCRRWAFWGCKGGRGRRTPGGCGGRALGRTPRGRSPEGVRRSGRSPVFCSMEGEKNGWGTEKGRKNDKSKFQRFWKLRKEERQRSRAIEMERNGAKLRRS